MACAHPFRLPHIYRSPRGSVMEFVPYNVPCGWCVNCIQDKINYISDRAKYELCTRLTGSFVTFTYDDVHLLTNCLPKGYDSVDLPKIIENKQFSLNYKDLTNFIENIRKYIKNHSEIQNVLCQPDFSYVYCGEYGDCFGRPHVHILFFGLDFAYCKKLIFEQWKNGLIDVLPILDGAIGYVCKYMSKQVKGSLAYDMYDSIGLARPKLRMSQNFGKGLLLDNAKDIKEHNLTYSVGRGLRRPISSYWRKLLVGEHIKADKHIVDSQTHSKMSEYHLKDFSKKGLESFRRQRAIIREQNIKNKLRSHGVPVAEYDDLFTNKYTSITWIREQLKHTSDEVKHWLAQDYIQSLKEAQSA